MRLPIRRRTGAKANPIPIRIFLPKSVMSFQSMALKPFQNVIHENVPGYSVTALPYGISVFICSDAATLTILQRDDSLRR